jgi:hypothetical protein
MSTGLYSVVLECDIVKVTSGVARFFYYSPINEVPHGGTPSNCDKLASNKSFHVLLEAIQKNNNGNERGQTTKRTILRANPVQLFHAINAFY